MESIAAKRPKTGETIVLAQEDRLGSGGEGCVYAFPGSPHLVLKLFVDGEGTPSPDRDGKARKLAAMLASPPEDPERGRGHVSIAWPTELVEGADGCVLGYAMPRVPKGAVPLQGAMQPGNRAKYGLTVDVHFLLGVARNLAAAVAAVHARGHRVGDISGANAFATPEGLVTIIDTDSFEVRSAADGTLWPTGVAGTSGYIPPEALRRDPPGNDDVLARDLFALAVVVHQLLMEGMTPFAVVPRGGRADACRDVDSRVAAGMFADPDRPRSDCEPAPAIALYWPTIPEEIRALFVRAFRDGHGDPSARPTAAQWVDALDRVLRDGVGKLKKDRAKLDEEWRRMTAAQQVRIDAGQKFGMPAKPKPRPPAPAGRRPTGSPPPLRTALDWIGDNGAVVGGVSLAALLLAAGAYVLALFVDLGK